MPIDKFLILDVYNINTKFLETRYLYLFINLVTILFPFLLSFDKKVAYYKSWKPLAIAIAIVGFVFIVWDILFTIKGVWGFNKVYLSGIELFHLPLGEWLFFVTVPYACVFIYECFRNYFKSNPLEKITNPIYLILISSFFITGFIFFGKVYLSGTLFLTASFLLYQYLFTNSKTRSWILCAYIISWIPFMIINGLLTGIATAEPIVMYNESEFSGIRILSVPLDDSIYSLLLLSMNLEIFERFRKRLG